VQIHGAKCWKKIASLLGKSANRTIVMTKKIYVLPFIGTTRTDVQCLHRYNKVLKPGLQKGTWTEAEDDIVRQMVRFKLNVFLWDGSYLERR
jgi:N-acetylneuraminic acid mutarotase